MNEPKLVRLEYLDIAKGIGIILVVLYHVSKEDRLLCYFLATFFMPMFFIISGMCYNEAHYPTFLTFLKKKIKRLLIPLIVFSAINIALSYVFHLEFYTIKFLVKGFPGAQWFVFCLFCVELTYYWIERLISDKVYKAFAILVSLAVAGLLQSNDISIPYKLYVIPLSVFFYGLGHQIKSFANVKLANVKMGGIGVILLILPLISAILVHDKNMFHNNIILHPEVYHLLLAIVGSFAILFISTSKRIFGNEKLKKTIIYIGQNTLIILLLHQLLIFISGKYIFPLLHSHIIYKIIEQCFLWGMMVGAIYIINCYLPFIVGKNFQNKNRSEQK